MATDWLERLDLRSASASLEQLSPGVREGVVGLARVQADRRAALKHVDVMHAQVMRELAENLARAAGALLERSGGSAASKAEAEAKIAEARRIFGEALRGHAVYGGVAPPGGATGAGAGAVGPADGASDFSSVVGVAKTVQRAVTNLFSSKDTPGGPTAPGGPTTPGGQTNHDSTTTPGVPTTPGGPPGLGGPPPPSAATGTGGPPDVPPSTDDPPGLGGTQKPGITQAPGVHPSITPSTGGLPSTDGLHTPGITPSTEYQQPTTPNGKPNTTDPKKIVLVIHGDGSDAAPETGDKPVSVDELTPGPGGETPDAGGETPDAGGVTPGENDGTRRILLIKTVNPKT